MSAHAIPQRIIQTARTNQLSPIGKAAVCNLRLLHPGWEYCFFDDDAVCAFMREEFPEYLSIFESFPRAIQRIDFFRYLAVLKLGGFYFDLDVLLSKSLASLGNKSCVFPFEELTISRFLRSRYGLDWELGNYGFGSVAGHPFLKAIVDGCVEAHRNPAAIAPIMNDIPHFVAAEFRVLNSTGPGMVTRIYADRPDLQESVHVLFPNDVCDQRQWHQFGEYGVHLMEGSWRTRGSIIWRKAASFWETRRRRKLHAESQILGPKRLPRITAHQTA